MTRRAFTVLALLFALGCSGGSQGNPASLWVDFENREVDLVLVDHEPPPF